MATSKIEATGFDRITYKSISLIMILCWLVNMGVYSQHLEEGFTSMFDGKDLSGWDGATRFWKVKDGAIIGETKKASRQTIFLYCKGGEPADFEMRCRFRILVGKLTLAFRSAVKRFRTGMRSGIRETSMCVAIP